VADLANSLVVVWAYTAGLPTGRPSGPLSGSDPYTTRWDVNGSEVISEEFRDEIERVTGAALARKEFTIVKMMVRGPNGEVCLDMPASNEVEERCPRGHRLVVGLPVGRQPTPVMFCPTCNAQFSKGPDATFVQVSDRPGQ